MHYRRWLAGWERMLHSDGVSKDLYRTAISMLSVKRIENEHSHLVEVLERFCLCCEEYLSWQVCIALVLRKS